MSLSIAGAMGLSSAIGAGSSLLNSGLSWWQANHAAHQNQRYAADQMAWQENMSNTAHQREVADLRAAGLNPILSATGGSGASTPVGQSGSLAQGDVTGFDLTSAREMYKYLDSQKKNIQADTDWKNEQKKTEKVQQKLIREQANAVSNSAKNTNLNNEILEMNMPAERNKAVVNENNTYHQKAQSSSDWYQGAKLVFDILGGFSNSASRIANVLKAPANYQNLRSYNPTFHYHK